MDTSAASSSPNFLTLDIKKVNNFFPENNLNINCNIFINNKSPKTSFDKKMNF